MNQDTGEAELRIATWNNCKRRGMRDNAAYKEIERAVEEWRRKC